MKLAKHAIKDIAEQDYKYGFVTEIEAVSGPKGLNADLILLISLKKMETEFILLNDSES